MCGIVGIVARPGRFAEADVSRAVASLHHRGPDAQGVARVFAGEHWECWFGHARLAIVDLSPAGAQPMVRAGEGAIVFNGEVYGHSTLRAAAPRWEFRSRSDTETLLARALDDPRQALVDANAMLAMALFDARRGRLVLGRDRLGKKPLFVYRGKDVLAFASELKAFAALGLPLTLDETALSEFRWLSYVPGPRSIWKECEKFPAASFATLELRARDLAPLVPEPFWDPLGGFARRFAGTYEDAKRELDALLSDATRIRLEADVPVGLFLSGGIDSSLVAAQVARTGRGDVRAFVVATDDARYDESDRATQTARRLGLPVEVIRVPRGAQQDTLQSLPWHYDEPNAAISQLGIMEMSRAAKQHATVVLTGDGGDEVFLGYPWVRYPALLAGPRRILRLPGSMRLLRAAGREPWLGAIAGLSSRVGLNPSTTARKLRIVEDAVGLRRDADVYELFQATRLRSELSADDRARIGDASLLDRLIARHPRFAWDAVLARGPEETASALDLLGYLRDDVLQKVDRGTMAHAIEARSPLLDHRIVTFGQSLPTDFKRKGRTHKRILRDLATAFVDADLSRRPKRGFSVSSPIPLGDAPLAAWCDHTERIWRARWAGS